MKLHILLWVRLGAKPMHCHDNGGRKNYVFDCGWTLNGEIVYFLMGRGGK